MTKLFRRIIRISAEDSPNVRFALAQRAAGKPITNEVLVEGVLTWERYVQRRATWDKIRQTIGLDALFYEGYESLMFPPEWLNSSHRVHERIQKKQRQAVAVGADLGLGESKTCFCAVDEHGVLEIDSTLTPDTSKIVGNLIAFVKRHRVDWNRVMIDRGCGGKHISDQIKLKGYEPQTIAFGSSIALVPKFGVYLPKYRKKVQEERYTYVNRRAQMYGDLRNLLDPSIHEDGFAIPSDMTELRFQMSPIPVLYDGEGRMYLPPKNKKPGQKIKTLTDMIGKSPDELDSLVLAVHGMLYEGEKVIAGPIWREMDYR